MMEEHVMYCDICGMKTILPPTKEGFPKGWFCSDNGQHSIDLCPVCANKYCQKMNSQDWNDSQSDKKFHIKSIDSIKIIDKNTGKTVLEFDDLDIKQ